jgi:hypothetical protein
VSGGRRILEARPILEWEYRKLFLNQHAPRGDELDLLNAAVTLTIVCALADPAAARDDRIMLPIRDALDAPQASAMLDKGVQLHFGGGYGGGIAKVGI